MGTFGPDLVFDNSETTRWRGRKDSNDEFWIGMEFATPMVLIASLSKILHHLEWT